MNLVVDGVRKRSGEEVALDDLSFPVEPGQSVPCATRGSR
jgi:hypothetical protein